MSRQTNIAEKVIINNSEKKPSVFERLGSKCNILCKNVCQNWADSGTCHLNKQCKLAQTHTLTSLSKRPKTDAMKKSVILHKKCKDDHKKILHSNHSSDVEWEGWELGDLEDADEKVLERRKQELQRELQLQLKKEKELTRKKEKRTEKKRAASSSSSTTTTTESSSSTTSTSSSSSEPRKRSNRKRKHSTSSSESIRSLHRQKKTAKVAKIKLPVKKQTDKKDPRNMDDAKIKSNVAAKKTSVQKKSYSPTWEKSRGRSPASTKGGPSVRKSPQRSPDAVTKNKSSPRCDKVTMKGKSRGYSPKARSREPSAKRAAKKVKESIVHLKDKHRSSPSKSRRVSPSRSRRREESSEKRRGHLDDSKHQSRKDRSREKERKRDATRARSNDNDSNGGLKKGGKILPLKPTSYNKEETTKKDIGGKSCEKSGPESKTKDIVDKDRNRADRDKGEKDKGKFERDRSRRKKSGEDHDKRPVRERDSERNTLRVRDERPRERDGDRSRFAKEREADRQKERDEALDRSRERQRDRDRLEKERKEKDERKHSREGPECKSNFERELPSLLDLKPENPNRNSGDGGGGGGKGGGDKHPLRETHRSQEKPGGEAARERRSSSERDHSRRGELRRLEETSARKPGAGTLGGDKEPESRRSREKGELRRSLGEGRQWDEGRHESHDRRRGPEPAGAERRQHRRHPREEIEADPRDFPQDERRGGSRKPGHDRSDWDVKEQTLDYRESETRDEWSRSSDRHRDWNSRYDHKWMDRDEPRDEGWNHYPRRGTREPWNGDWTQDHGRQTYPETERCHPSGDNLPEGAGKRRNGSEGMGSTEGNKDKGPLDRDQVSSAGQRGEKMQRGGGGDALSDISDDPDDILNRDDFPTEETLSSDPPQVLNPANNQIYIRSNEFLFDQKRPLLECLGERSLDFEEISDDELEEEARANKGIVDVLGADWAGLLQETRLKQRREDVAGSAHLRWTTTNLVSALGISLKYGGEEFVRKFSSERAISNGQPESGSLRDKSVANEDSADVNEMDNEEKIFLEKEMQVQIFHAIPGLHSTLRDSKSIKCHLFSSHNRFKRALSARTDLALRRELCNLPSKEPLHFTPPLDNKMFEASVHQFRGGGATTAAV